MNPQQPPPRRSVTHGAPTSTASAPAHASATASSAPDGDRAELALPKWEDVNWWVAMGAAGQLLLAIARRDTGAIVAAFLALAAALGVRLIGPEAARAVAQIVEERPLTGSEQAQKMNAPASGSSEVGAKS